MAHDQGRRAEWPSQFRLAAWKDIGRRVTSEVRRDNLSIVAAGVAYYAFLALFPALVALISLYGLIADPSDVERLMRSANAVMPGEASTLLNGQLHSLVTSSSSSLSLGVAFSVLLALWSAMSGTKTLMTAFNIAYEEDEKRGFLHLNAVALMLTLGVIAGAVVAMALVTAVPVVLGSIDLPGPWSTVISWLRWPVLGVAMLAGLAVLYRYAPSRERAKWRWVSAGAVVTTLLWLIASGLFSWYVSHFGSYNKTYGSLAAVVILLMWFYISAFLILLGAEINSEMEHQTAADTTTGAWRAMGERGAEAADRVIPGADDSAAGAAARGRKQPRRRTGG